MRNLVLACSLAFVCISAGSTTLVAADSDSKFTLLAIDATISGTNPVTVLSTTINFAESRSVLVVADGRYFPYSVAGTAVVEVRIDGSTAYSNDSIIDFTYSANPVQHSFNSIAVATLGSGSHTFSLTAYNHASTPTAMFRVGSGSGMSVLTNPAPHIAASALSVDSSIVNFTTQGIGDSGPLPMATMLGNFVPLGPNTQKVVTLASGRSYHACTGCWGDALWGIFVDNETCQSNDEALWSVNDINNRSELHAPMYAHSLHELSGNHTLLLKASELSFNFEDQVRYRLGARTRLVTLWGMQVAGAAIASTTNCNRADFVCIGTSGGSGCAAIGQWTEIASDSFTIPQGHNGVVLFMAKTRVQGDAADLGGNMFLQIQLDGQFVGTVGVQQLKYPDSISSRTVSASYLTTGSTALSPGVHTVKVMGKADSGSFKHLSVSRDIPLTYID